MRRYRTGRLKAVSAAALLVGGLSLAACGDDDGGDEGSDTTEATEETEETSDSGDTEETEDTTGSEETEDTTGSEDGGDEAEVSAVTTGEDEGSGPAVGGMDNDAIRAQASDMYQDMLGLDQGQADCMVDQVFDEMGDDLSEVPQMDVSAAMEWLEACDIDPTELQPGG